ncbi:outer membrane beta-barrel protein [Sabulilitoribacter multivorans]|uniref:Outer membrane beta-barrel protein n=1 Tax=Flaviramulus multivorans TaxID=1304750 RepID=A0ABS9IHL0_9FLAO|nr:outer membrane beta-barrel protein [Flaviramulus multivorans]MCF7560248.1 outer membrane beta-barrel protein [Flaviramulus multivorans]
MKKYLLIFLISTISFLGYSQQLYMELGSTISSFDYENSQGLPLDNLLSKSDSYFGMGYRQVINNQKTLFLALGASYNNYGAIGSESSVDNFFEWDVSYLGIKAGLDYRIFQLKDLSFFVKGSVASEFLIRGNQTINNDVYNLVGEEEFNNNILFLRAGIGLQYPISNSTAIYAGYSYGKSVLISSGENAEKLKLNAHQFGIGFIINLPNCFCDF